VGGAHSVTSLLFALARAAQIWGIDSSPNSVQSLVVYRLQVLFNGNGSPSVMLVEFLGVGVDCNHTVLELINKSIICCLRSELVWRCDCVFSLSVQCNFSCGFLCEKSNWPQQSPCLVDKLWPLLV
jgi:hypothetical protein